MITFDKKPTRQSLGIYLHWNGGPESVLAFLEAANEFRVRAGDDPYQLARFVQIIGNYFGGTTSIGLDKLSKLDCDNGDNGVLRVSRAGLEGAIEIHQSNIQRRFRPSNCTDWKTATGAGDNPSLGSVSYSAGRLAFGVF